MKTEIKYIEIKSGFSGNGTAWIGLVSFSKSGKTIYFNGQAFQSLNGNGISGNYFNIENGDEYWISGVKKDMSDRHRFGSGKILVEKRILNEYLKIINRTALPKNKFDIVEVNTNIPTQKIYELENETHNSDGFDRNLYFKKPSELATEEIEFVIEELMKDETNCKYSKGRKFYKKARFQLEVELNKRKNKLVE